jgi:hypothetical protein
MTEPHVVPKQFPPLGKPKSPGLAVSIMPAVAAGSAG